MSQHPPNLEFPIEWSSDMDNFLIAYHKKYECEIFSLESTMTNDQKSALWHSMVKEFQRNYGAHYDSEKLKARWRTLRNFVASAKKKKAANTRCTGKEEWMYQRCLFLLPYINSKNPGMKTYSAQSSCTVTSNTSQDGIAQILGAIDCQGTSNTGSGGGVHVSQPSPAQVSDFNSNVTIQEEASELECAVETVEYDGVVFGDHDYETCYMPIYNNSMFVNDVDANCKGVSNDVDANCKEVSKVVDDHCEGESSVDYNKLYKSSFQDMNFPKKPKKKQDETPQPSDIREILPQIEEILPKINEDLCAMESEEEAVDLTRTLWEMYQSVEGVQRIPALKIIMDILEHLAGVGEPSHMEE
ncbi:hypothetical protein QAD02_003631 [Eretmocerus hayati]|uniref:Uncharacterized protein n=1 Tax=Eretmocerus hayati TaxID=131215 RepID=A0ACC2NQ52_9HYME|nr:hypothetical protein QAD02_003631 [Eretmocerus hayati]